MAHDPSMGVLLRVAYDGTAFKGWASQKDVRTVETTLRGAVLAMDDQAGSLRGTSRTDAGVHAEDQVVAFDSARDIPAKGWVLGPQPAPTGRRARFALLARSREASPPFLRTVQGAIAIATAGRSG